MQFRCQKIIFYVISMLKNSLTKFSEFRDEKSSAYPSPFVPNPPQTPRSPSKTVLICLLSIKECGYRNKIEVTGNQEGFDFQEFSTFCRILATKLLQSSLSRHPNTRSELPGTGSTPSVIKALPRILL